VTACDLAIERYRQALEPKFGPSVVFIQVEREGTRV
jgi:hypothetical protein